MIRDKLEGLLVTRALAVPCVLRGVARSRRRDHEEGWIAGLQQAHDCCERGATWQPAAGLVLYMPCDDTLPLLQTPEDSDMTVASPPVRTRWQGYDKMLKGVLCFHILHSWQLEWGGDSHLACSIIWKGHMEEDRWTSGRREGERGFAAVKKIMAVRRREGRGSYLCTDEVAKGWKSIALAFLPAD